MEHTDLSLARFKKSASYLARKYRFGANDIQDAAQEALIRAWQAPPDKPLSYYEKAMRNRLLDFQEGARFGTIRANHGGRGPLRVTSVTWLGDSELPESQQPATRDEYPSDTNLSWAYHAARNQVDREMLDDVVSGRTEKRGRYIFPDRHQNQWPEFKRYLKGVLHDNNAG